MKTRVFFGSIAVTALTLACGGAETSSAPADESQDVTQTKVFMCQGLGRNEAMILQLTSKGVTLTEEGVAIQRGTAAASSDADKLVFGDFSAGGTVGAGDQVVVPKSLATTGKGTVELHMANVNPIFQADCHKATTAELQADHCEPLVEEMGFVDSNRKPEIVKDGDAYTVTIKDSKAGDYVYTVPSKVDGLLCTVSASKAVSCSAVVADKIFSRARDDGSSSGLPFVNKVSDTEYTGGIHDVESGEFAYDVKTSGSDDGCKVTSVKSTN
jgi:hypothetical protein